MLVINYVTLPNHLENHYNKNSNNRMKLMNLGYMFNSCPYHYSEEVFSLRLINSVNEIDRLSCVNKDISINLQNSNFIYYFVITRWGTHAGVV